MTMLRSSISLAFCFLCALGTLQAEKELSPTSLPDEGVRFPADGGVLNVLGSVP